MDFLNDLPVPLFAAVVFGARVVDVSLGTLRTLAIVGGRWPAAMLLGFVEVTIWIAVVSQVVRNVTDSPLLGVAFAGGFAAGNATGLWLERTLGQGRQVLRMIVPGCGKQVVQVLRDMGQAATTFEGQGRNGPITLIYLLTPSGSVRPIVNAARAVCPEVFYVADRADSWRSDLPMATYPGGWRAWWKKK